jgi:hypothetical protein
MVQDKKKVNPFGLLGAAAASIASMLAGSTLGVKGTIIGAGLGAVVSGVVVVWTENAAVKAHEKVTRLRHRGTEDEFSTRLIPALKVKKNKRPLMFAGLGLMVMLLSAGSAFGLLGIVRGATGTTLGNYTSNNTPVVTPTVTVTPTEVITTVPPVVTSPSFSATPSPSPTPTPTPSPSPTPTPSPDAIPSVFSSPSVTVSPVGK